MRKKQVVPRRTAAASKPGRPRLRCVRPVLLDADGHDVAGRSLAEIVRDSVQDAERGAQDPGEHLVTSTPKGGRRRPTR